MLGFGLFVLAQAGYKLMYPEVPSYRVIELVALAALAANAVCLALLWRHRGDVVAMSPRRRRDAKPISAANISCSQHFRAAVRCMVGVISEVTPFSDRY